MNDQYTELYEKLTQLQGLLMRYSRRNGGCGPFADPTQGQGRVLAMLKIQPEISTKELAYLLGIRIPSLNELLNKLEKGGFILREPSEADKRVMVIRLTEKGKATEQTESRCSGLFDGFREEELTTLAAYLDRMILTLEAQIGEEPSEEDVERWLHGARSRMSEEQLERLMAMGGGLRRHGRDRGGHRGGRPGEIRQGDDSASGEREYVGGAGESFFPGGFPRGFCLRDEEIIEFDI